MTALETKPVTVINVFRMQPQEHQEALQKIERTCSIMKVQPGFVEATIYSGVERRRIAVRSQWTSRVNFDAAFKLPAVVDLLRGMLSWQPEWHVYETARCLEKRV
jgi:antibiotic biosynthesis monooxygenase (ABM) superfamily enzyme